MNILESIWAFIKGPFTEVSVMPDDLIQSGTTDSTAQAVALNAAAMNVALSQPSANQIATDTPAQISSPAAVDAPAPDLVETLETILKALGHQLPVFWDEAVALAKKAL
jgi:hypothetical protein